MAEPESLGQSMCGKTVGTPSLINHDAGLIVIIAVAAEGWVEHAGECIRTLAEK